MQRKNNQQRVVTSMERKQQVLGFGQRKPVGERQGKHGSASGRQTDWKAAEEPASEVQNVAMIAPPQEQAEQAERALQLFDMDMAFGPCTGLSRLERWQRANRLGLNPPPHVRALLESASCREDSVWEGRVRLGLNPPPHVRALLESASCREDSVWVGQGVRGGRGHGGMASRHLVAVKGSLPLGEGGWERNGMDRFKAHPSRLCIVAPGAVP
ncbi:unnamed protein product [Closterium sp. NIES-65]|nr:unnamed protein product [Closterium sp. NIES-65]